MSVRELEQVAGAGRTARSIEQTVEAHLHQIVTTSDGLLGRATEWRASLLRLEDEPTTPELVELLQNAAQKQRSVAQACAANAGLLEARIDKATAELDGERAKETAKPANGKRAPATKKAQR